MLKPAGRPLLDTAHHLVAKFFVLDSARRLGRKSKDGFFVRGRLLQPHAFRDYGLEKLRTKDPANLFVDFLAQRRALIMKRHYDAENLQLRIWPGLYFLDRLEQVVRSFERKVGGLNR